MTSTTIATFETNFQTNFIMVVPSWWCGDAFVDLDWQEMDEAEYMGIQDRNILEAVLQKKPT